MAKSPDAFRTISEVAEWLETPAHVLRFWESRFTQIAPVKGAGSRRYYRPEDMLLLGGIKHLLHEEGHTIKSVQNRLKVDGVSSIASLSKPLRPAQAVNETRPPVPSKPSTSVSRPVAAQVPHDPADDARPSGPVLSTAAELRAIGPGNWPDAAEIAPLYDRIRALRDRMAG
jgi:DNA-binding transcriptional MerR regulator